MESRVLLGTTPTLAGYPRLRPSVVVQGVPSAASCEVRTPGAVSPTAPCQVDTLQAEVLATALAHEPQLVTEDAPWVLGRRYLVSYPDGRPTSTIEAAVGGTSGRLHLSRGLREEVPVGSVVRGFACLRTLTTTETASPGEASILWTATVDGATYQWAQLFRVVRRIPTALLTADRLARLYPQVVQMETPGDDPEMVVTSAWDALMMPLLEAHGLFDDEAISDEALVPLHALACMLMLHDFDFRLDQTARDHLRRRWDSQVSQTFGRKGMATLDSRNELEPRTHGAGKDVSVMRVRL
jgi:hypothetical protein